MTDEGTGSLPAAVTKAYDVLLWLITHVGKFPRSHRFVLGERIESRMLSPSAGSGQACRSTASGLDYPFPCRHVVALARVCSSEQVFELVG
jgi:hypothetical protein